MLRLSLREIIPAADSLRFRNRSRIEGEVMLTSKTQTAQSGPGTPEQIFFKL